MILVTTDEVPGHRVTRVIGLVQGSSVRGRHLGKDVTAFFKNLTGGEIREYTKLLAEAREVTEVDDNGMTRQRIVFHAVDRVQFAASVTARGQVPIPAYAVTAPLAASCERMGQTPPRFAMSHCTTCSTKPTATAASAAVPPASRMRSPAIVAAGWPAETAWRTPESVGRVVTGSARRMDQPR